MRIGDRLQCLVPGCRRTFKVPELEVAWTMCGKHWRLSPKLWRRRLAKLDRCFKRTRKPHARYLSCWMWHACARRAIDVALGIGT